MTQDDRAPDHLERLARGRVRSLRLARGWTLDDLAQRCFISASTISRIETGHRRLALDHLGALARALEVTVDDLIGEADDTDVVIRPAKMHSGSGALVWPLTRGHDPSGRVVAKVRYSASTRRPEPKVHPGRDWFYVIEGTARLVLGEREHLVQAGQAAEFDTLTPHWIAGYGGPVEILMIFDRHGESVHLHPPARGVRPT